MPEDPQPLQTYTDLLYEFSCVRHHIFCFMLFFFSLCEDMAAACESPVTYACLNNHDIILYHNIRFA